MEGFVHNGGTDISERIQLSEIIPWSLTTVGGEELQRTGDSWNGLTNSNNNNNNNHSTYTSTTTSTQNGDNGDISSSSTHLKVPFPVRHDLNAQISLIRGQIWKLEVDAIVNSSNETLTETSGVCGAIQAHAGPDLLPELERMEGCRTGEAKICPGFNLPSRNIIYTVGPRFNPKYLTAAENALHSSYRSSLQMLIENRLTTIAFPTIHSENRGYPSENGANIAVRTIRRFLERHGKSITRVIICLDRVPDFDMYSTILPLYFPRNEEEEERSVSLLPPDTGNEDGETVLEERKIRITSFPGMPSEDDEEPEVSEPIQITLKPKSSTDSPSVMVTVRTEIDEEKKKRIEAKPESQVEREQQEIIYARYLRNARKEDLSDIAQMNIIYQSGVDQLGRPVVIIVGHHIPARKVDMERVLMYMIRIMDPIVDKDYVIVYLHTFMTSDHQPEFAWLRHMHSIFDRKYSRNMRALYVVHPTFWLKVLFVVLGPFISSAFSSEKLRYFDRLADLLNVVDLQGLNLPKKKKKKKKKKSTLR
eukprot:TRINITY_DN3210_c0_g2_i1.p1 TRINITY_DN3210_c0_g2~~TRINITY_DN3210_c0_g2_i1.p1  ORF type:complete len:534 (+),score=95.25 TRINITY_DN3210_c0_g2_i1:237-1838(+)